jgi:hypothetical protein
MAKNPPIKKPMLPELSQKRNGKIVDKKPAEWDNK